MHACVRTAAAAAAAAHVQHMTLEMRQEIVCVSSRHSL